MVDDWTSSLGQIDCKSNYDTKLSGQERSHANEQLQNVKPGEITTCGRGENVLLGSRSKVACEQLHCGA